VSRRRHDVELHLLPSGRRVGAEIGETVLRALQRDGVAVAGSCGGRGTCGKCRVRFAERSPEPTTADRAAIEVEALRVGWRLACQHEVEGQATIELLEMGELPHKERVGGLDALQAVDPFGEPRDDVDAYGVAIDIGTTTIAAHLFDLGTGRRLAGVASRNPQIPFGADVISRISHVRRHGESGLSDLHDAVVEGLNRLIRRAAELASVPASSIRSAIAVGNPTMLHLLLSVDPSGIGVSPFRPVFSEGMERSAENIGLEIRPDAAVRTFPGISGYVGADIVAGILATDLDEAQGTILFLDIGTNGEVVLAIDGRLTACSTAAGPAFEGASIVQGMPAMDGAIEGVRLEGRRIVCSTIGDVDAVGLCGTGLLSAVAELVAGGAIDRSGRFVDGGSPVEDQLRGEGAERRMRLTDGERPVYLYQRDVREVQLAKGAMRAGIDILLRSAGVAPEELDRILIAGAFSAGLTGEHLVATGLLPEIDPARIRNVGQTAVRGAAISLLDRSRLRAADRIAQSVEVVELSADPSFAGLFVECMAFPRGA